MNINNITTKEISYYTTSLATGTLTSVTPTGHYIQVGELVIMTALTTRIRIVHNNILIASGVFDGTNFYTIYTQTLKNHILKRVGTIDIICDYTSAAGTLYLSFSYNDIKQGV